MKHYLRESELTRIDTIHFCNYCGEEAFESVSFSDHGHTRDVDYLCECEGAKLSAELKSRVFNTRQLLEEAERDLNKYMSQVHPSIKQRLFNQEEAALRLKYGISGESSE